MTLVDPTLRRIVVLFRVLGWGWMALLVALETAAGTLERPWVAYLALSVATGMTVVTAVASRAHHRLASPVFVAVDLTIALAIGVVSPLAGSAELIHGGYPMSWVVLMAYAGGLRWVVPLSLVFTVEQWFLRLETGRPQSGAAFAVVFIVFAVVTGWAFDSLRQMSSRLAAVESARARSEARADIATRLHDSVLQTLHAIGAEADDPGHVRYLARRQERELRRTIDEYLSPYDASFRAALLAARDDVEDLHRVKIEMVIRDDLPLTEELEAVVDAAREAMMNAAKHSGAPLVNVYSEASGDAVKLIVMDRGSGFEPGEALGGGGLGLARSVTARVERFGGKVKVESAPGAGTEITITAPHPGAERRAATRVAEAAGSPIPPGSAALTSPPDRPGR